MLRLLTCFFQQSLLSPPDQGGATPRSFEFGFCCFYNILLFDVLSLHRIAPSAVHSASLIISHQRYTDRMKKAGPSTAGPWGNVSPLHVVHYWILEFQPSTFSEFPIPFLQHMHQPYSLYFADCRWLPDGDQTRFQLLNRRQCRIGLIDHHCCWLAASSAVVNACMLMV